MKTATECQECKIATNYKESAVFWQGKYREQRTAIKELKEEISRIIENQGVVSVIERIERILKKNSEERGVIRDEGLKANN